MNKLTTAVLGFTLLVGSAFAAAPQANTSKMADQTAPSAKTKVKKAKKTSAKKTAPAATPAATPAK